LISILIIARLELALPETLVVVAVAGFEAASLS